MELREAVDDSDREEGVGGVLEGEGWYERPSLVPVADCARLSPI